MKTVGSGEFNECNADLNARGNSEAGESLDASLRELDCTRIEKDAGGFVHSARRGGVGDIWEGGEPKSYSRSSSMIPSKVDRGGKFDGARLGLCERIRGVCGEEVGVGQRYGVQKMGYR